MRLSWIKKAVIDFRYVPVGMINIYQKVISPLMFPSCRFYPSCSTYARLAFGKYGIFKGGMISLIRLLKCHPFHPGGYDPLD